MISRISISKITPQFFLEHYFEKERPLIITGVSSNGENHQWSFERVQDLIIQNNFDRNKLWFQTNLQDSRLEGKTPKLVSDSLDPKLSYCKRNNIRIWLNKKGDHTLLHTDANGLFVFNLQIVGQKEWNIFPPETDIKFYSFSNIPLLKYNKSLTGGISFTLQEGDMLFLPAYWIHKVQTISDLSANINWTGTKKRQRSNPIFERENKLFKILLPLSNLSSVSNFIDKTLGSEERNYLRYFAGNGGFPLIKKRITNVLFFESFLLVMKEMVALPRLIFSIKKIKAFSKTTLINKKVPKEVL